MHTASFSPQTFIQLALDNQALQFGEFTLKSGRISPYFFNAGLLATGELLSLLASGFAQTLAKLHTDKTPPVIFGAAYKGIPFAAATAQALWREQGINAEWGYNRKEVKDHGEGGQLVGKNLSGKSVWIVDDVITAGTAIKEVLQLLNHTNAKVQGILIALDRKERGQGDLSAIQELQQNLNIPIKALIDIDDLIAYIQDHGNADQLRQMQNYRQQYGIN